MDTQIIFGRGARPSRRASGGRRAPLARARSMTSMAALVVVVALTGTLALAPASATVAPPARSGAAMAHDAGGSSMVLFGGSGIASGACCRDLGDTWIYRKGWTQATPPVSPAARSQAAMASDPATGGVLLFGGKQNPVFPGTVLGDTWTWDGSTEQWTQRSTLIAPPPRFAASVAADATTGEVVLFGGTADPYDGRPPLSDTWTWNGSTGTWTLQHPPVSPPARYGASMAHDPATGAVVLFGGLARTSFGELLGDTWTWDGRARTWTLQEPAEAPSPRYGAALSYHPHQKGRLVLFGGDPGQPDDQTWVWKGSAGTWTRLVPVSAPSPRAWAAMGYFPQNRKVVLFGGQGSSLPLGDGWLWNGSDWSPQA